MMPPFDAASAAGFTTVSAAAFVALVPSTDALKDLAVEWYTRRLALEIIEVAGVRYMANMVMYCVNFGPEMFSQTLASR